MTTFIDVMHSSMQFSDTAGQKDHDARVIFERAKRRKVWWVTGTEAGEQPLTGLLHDYAKANNYTFVEFKSNWIAIARDNIVPKSYSTEHFTIVDNDLTVGKGQDSSLLVAHFTHETLGKITVMASHYPRYGDPSRLDKMPQPNLKYTHMIAAFIGQKAREYGKGKAKVFYGGDQNIQDEKTDTFMGNPLTSLADELNKHENTGHGEIDVIASYDGDKRVKGRYWRALSDKEFFLYTDHFTVEGGFEVA